MDGMSLLDVLRGVMLDPAEQAAYNADPGAYLERYGYDDVDPADLSEAFGLVADTLPADQAQAAWDASTVADNGSFGTVTADFDADTTEADLPATDGVAEGPSTGDPGAADVEALLSFGEGGADTGDIDDDPSPGDVDDPSFGDASTLGSSGLDIDGGVAGSQGAGGGTDVVDVGELDDDIDDIDGGGLDDIGADVDGGLQDRLDDIDAGGADDLDDLEEIDGLGGLDDPGPDDLDIGSF